MATVPKGLCMNGDGQQVHARDRCKPCYDTALWTGAIDTSGPRPFKFSWNPAWTAGALCASEDAELFFAPDGESEPEREVRERKAKAICAGCRARPGCLTVALDMRPAPAGVWGATNELDRDRLRRRARKERQREQAQCEQEVAA